MGKVRDKIENFSGRLLDETLAKLMIDAATTDKLIGVIDRNAEGFTVGLFGVLSPRFRVAFESIFSLYVEDDLMVKQGIGQARADILAHRVTDFLEALPEDWLGCNYMLRVVTSKSVDDRRAILSTLVRAAGEEDETERKRRMLKAVKRAVGKKPLLTSLGKYIAQESPNAWQAITKKYPGGLAEMVKKNWPEAKEKTHELSHWLMHGSAPQPNQASEAQTGWQGAITESQKLLEWSEARALEIEEQAKKGKFLALGSSTHGIFKKRGQ